MNAAASGGRAGGLLGKLTNANVSQPPNPEPSAPLASVTPVAPAKPAARTVQGRFTVRVYDAEHLAAWTEVRSVLGTELGRIPSQSEVAEVAARVLLDSAEARARAVELLQRG